MNGHRLRRRAIIAALVALSAGLLHADDERTAEPAGLWDQFLHWREQRIAVTDTYLVSSTGAGYAAIQDTRMTPLVYRAPGFAAFAEARTYRPHEVVLGTAFFHYTQPSVPEASGGAGTFSNPRGTLEVAYFRSLPGVSVRLGGAMTLTGNLRQLDTLGNSALNYDLAVAINPTVLWETDFTLLGRPASWYLRASTPLLSWVLRQPGYNLSYGEPQTMWALPWRFTRVRLSLGLSRLMQYSDENRLRLDYHYDFYATYDAPTGHRLTLGNHSITFGYATKVR